MAQLQRLVIDPVQCMAQTIHLTPQQQHYLTRVLRLGQGNRFIAICDGKWWLAQVQSPVQAQLIEPVLIQTELEQPITLVAAVTKGQGFDEVVRAATELGAATLVPLLSTRTLLEPSAHKLERWRRIATEAAEQSCRQVVPDIFAPVKFEDALALAQTEPFTHQQRFICVTHKDSINLGQALATMPQMGILIMVGPEGGWTATEQASAIAQGFRPVSLGRRVLRAVTASVAVVAVLATRLEAARS